MFYVRGQVTLITGHSGNIRALGFLDIGAYTHTKSYHIEVIYIYVRMKLHFIAYDRVHLHVSAYMCTRTYTL